jgi:uncharacterized protein with von Willebrand factor type A (vWA) domain
MQSGDLIRKLFGRGGATSPEPLPRSTVTHDGIDAMQFGNYADDSPSFKAAAIEDAPRIAPDVPEPPMPDFKTATPDEVKAYQQQAKAAQDARSAAPAYTNWEELTRDLFYSYHHVREPKVLDPGEVDPGVSFHGKIMSKMMAEDDHAESRNITRDDAPMSAMATKAALNVLKGALEEEMVSQAREAEEFEKQRDQANDAMDQLESLRALAKDQMQQNGQVDPQLVQDIKNAVQQKRQAQQQAAQMAQAIPAKFSAAAHSAVVAAATAALDAAKAAKNVPSFGQGFGKGEPIYESPEQALSIAELWSTGMLAKVAELYGRMSDAFHFMRAKRVTGGQDEIVDIKLGDDLKRIVGSELAYLADDDLEDDFYARYSSGELLVYETVGEALAGRGPVVLVVDGSYSMKGDRMVWSRAVALTLLNLCRREKRDFAFVEFADMGDCHVMLFRQRDPLRADDIVEMASHFFGGGTEPLQGMEAALKVMEESEFRMADVVIVSDGEAKFKSEDKIVRDRLNEMGVRIHGIGIGQSFGYLEEMCHAETITTIHDMDLHDPNSTVGELAVQLT